MQDAQCEQPSSCDTKSLMLRNGKGARKFINELFEPWKPIAMSTRIYGVTLQNKKTLGLA
jgi:hypothetical protein